MNRIAKTIEFSVPPALAKEVERFASAEHRTKDELFREMVRVYREHRASRPVIDEAFVLRLIEEAKANPMSEDEIRIEERRLARYGQQQARKLGIKPKDVNRLIREYRAGSRP